MKGIVHLKVKDGNDVNNKLIDVCKYICSYYEEIKKELLLINNNIALAWECVRAYDKFEIAKMNFNNYSDSLNSEVLINIVTSLEQIDKSFKEEFSQGIDFFNLGEQIFKTNNKSQISNFISNAKKSMIYTIYQLDRIYQAKTMTKKLAILKGMIAYN